MERYRSHLVWEAWTDFGSVGAGRKCVSAILRKSDNFSQELAQPRVDPTSRRCEACVEYFAAWPR